MNTVIWRMNMMICGEKIDDLPIKKLWFSIAILNNQRIILLGSIRNIFLLVVYRVYNWMIIYGKKWWIGLLLHILIHTCHSANIIIEWKYPVPKGSRWRFERTSFGFLWKWLVPITCRKSPFQSHPNPNHPWLNHIKWLIYDCQIHGFFMVVM